MIRRLVPLSLVFIVLSFGVPALGATSPDALPSLNPVIERASAAVVNISVSGTVETGPPHPLFNDPFFRRFFGVPDMPLERRVRAVGSGVIIDAEEGYVLTNHHVIANADRIEVTLNDRRQLTAEVLGTDPETDVALLQVEGDGLAEVEYGDSGQLQIGDFVIAIGNPFGIGQTATLGIVSALGRSGLGIEGYENFIQTDASINPGNSGGALINQEGELVGLNTAILSRSGGNIGIGFAIPSNMVRQIVAQLLEYGEVKRGRLGVVIQPVTSEIATAMELDEVRGALVAEVSPDTPAAEAGLQSGDVILAVNGSPVEDSDDLRNRIGMMRPGATVELSVLRDGDRREIEVELAEAENQVDKPSLKGRFEGTVLTPIPENHPLAGQVSGVFVRYVRPGSTPARASLRPGDIIVSANRQNISSISDLAEAAGAVGEKPLLLRVRREAGALYLTLPK